jgi:NitT/TauT family transport system substrate-binding protein
LAEHQASTVKINTDVEAGATLTVAAGIVAQEGIAVKAIPQCNITYMDGRKMKQALSGYLEVLYGQNPQSIGGGLPADDFYYLP